MENIKKLGHSCGKGQRSKSAENKKLLVTSRRCQIGRIALTGCLS